MSEKQGRALDSLARDLMLSGGFRAGKTVIACIKLIVKHLTQKNNRVLIGRLTYPELRDSTQKTFFSLLPPEWIKSWNKTDNLLTLRNGTEVLFRHLDTTSEEELKGMELGAAFIDQVEEISEEVYLILKSRLNIRHVEHRQLIMTCNPLLFWGYKYFKQEFDSERELIEFSMMDNKHNLPEDYLSDMLKRPENWKRQFVHGIWDESLLSDRSVIPIEYIQEQRAFVRKPIRMLEGVEIYENLIPRDTYQMGIDTSEGDGQDYSSFSVTNLCTGAQVAFWKGKVPVDLLRLKVIPVARYFNNCRLVPEMNGSGLAFLVNIKAEYDNIYHRTVFEEGSDQATKKLGWRTTSSTKPILVEDFLRLLRTAKIKIRSESVCDQMATFVFSTESKKSGMGAEKGFHDDDLIAHMLSLVEINEYRDKIEHEHTPEISFQEMYAPGVHGV